MDDLTLLETVLIMDIGIATYNKYEIIFHQIYQMDLLAIYESFLRSNLEQSAAVWHSSLSKCNEFDLERVQKSALSDSR